MKIFLILTAVVFSITACNDPKPVSWYVDHPEEMRAKMKQCNEDVTLFVKDGDCANASKAWNKRFFAPPKVNEKNDSPGLFPLKGK